MLLYFRFHRQSAGKALVIESIEILGFNRVRNGNNLRVRQRKEGAHVGPSLATAADDGEVHLFARGNKIGPAQNMARHKGESSDCRRPAANKHPAA